MVGLVPWKLILLTWKKNLEETDKIKYQESINSNKQQLDSLKDKTASEWREYATQCMIEILDHKTKS